MWSCRIFWRDSCKAVFSLSKLDTFFKVEGKVSFSITIIIVTVWHVSSRRQL
jgi:hypothetical protein